MQRMQAVSHKRKSLRLPRPDKSGLAMTCGVSLRVLNLSLSRRQSVVGIAGGCN